MGFQPRPCLNINLDFIWLKLSSGRSSRRLSFKQAGIICFDLYRYLPYFGRNDIYKGIAVSENSELSGKGEL
jgi:hypothetical protein